MSTEKANAVVDAINSAKSGRALAVVGDILDGDYVTDLVKKAADFGNGKIHIIVNNAGFTWDGVIHKVRRHRHGTYIALPGVLPSTLTKY